MITCDGVRVIVPSLLCDVENFRNHCSGPAGQFAKTHRKMRVWVSKVKKQEERTGETSNLCDTDLNQS